MVSDRIEHMFECQYGKQATMSKFRVGALVGLAVGYYLGSRAGRERYHQINKLVRRARTSGALDHAITVAGKAKAVVDLTRERVVDVTDQRTDVARP
jgi:hypothetical protein